MPTVFVHISVKDYVPDDMSDIVDFLTNPQKFPTTNWREKTKEKRKTLLSKLFDFGEDFKISDLENGKSPKLHNVNKSSNTKSVQSNGRASVPPSPQHEDSKPLAGNKSSVPAFTEEVTKQQITKKPTHPLVKAEPSNGQPMQSKSTIQSLLDDPSLLVPTPLKDLKNQKGFFKVICKRDKELESLSKKHEKWKRKHKELRKTQAEVFVAMCKDHFQAEMDVMLKHHDSVYDVLKLIMDINHREHDRKLTAIFEMEVEEHRRKMEEHSKKEMKTLSKMYKDKNELARIKREAQTKHIDEVVQERAKHKDLLYKKKDELKRELSLIQQEYEKEREMVPKEYRAIYEEKCRKLTEQFRDVGLCDSREELNGEQNTPL